MSEMPHSYDEVLEVPLKLPQRELLADALLAFVLPDSGRGHESWIAESQRRSRKLDENASSAIPWKEV